MTMRDDRRRLITAGMAALAIFAWFAMMTAFSSLAPKTDDGPVPPTTLAPTRERIDTLSLTVHSPIVINGNAGFTNASGVVRGDGSDADPFIIEGLDINASSSDGIRIWNTDAHFIVRGCYIHDGGDNYTGVYLFRCTNGTVRGNLFTNNLWGTFTYLSDNNTLADNTCTDCDVGMRLYSSPWISLLNNTCVDNTYGIILFYPSNCTVSLNNCSSNSVSGIFIQSSNHTLINDNFVSRNNLSGIHIISSGDTALVNNTCSDEHIGVVLSSSSNTSVSECTISDNEWYGLCVYGDSGPPADRIWNNTFYHNMGGGDVFNPALVQAWDEGTPEEWDCNGYGNYWSDWRGPDAGGDGVVDDPYVIAGSSGAADHSPRTDESFIPEYWIAPAVIGTVCIALAARHLTSKMV